MNQSWLRALKFLPTHRNPPEHLDDVRWNAPNNRISAHVLTVCDQSGNQSMTEMQSPIHSVTLDCSHAHDSQSVNPFVYFFQSIQSITAAPRRWGRAIQNTIKSTTCQNGHFRKRGGRGGVKIGGCNACWEGVYGSHICHASMVVFCCDLIIANMAAPLVPLVHIRTGMGYCDMAWSQGCVYVDLLSYITGTWVIMGEKQYTVLFTVRLDWLC